jgi:T5orf172 domain
LLLWTGIGKALTIAEVGSRVSALHGPGEATLTPSILVRNVRAISRQLARTGHAAVYAISTKDRSPTKIGVTSDINTRLDHMQRGNWNELYLYYVLWFPDKEIASVVEGAAKMLLIQNRLTRGWFNVTPAQARRAITGAAARVYPGVRLIEHAEMVRLLHGQKDMA